MATSWQDTSKKDYPPQTTDLECDVVIVGGGLVGITSAYLLAKEGKNVVVIESDYLGGWATIDTTAHITQIIDTSSKDLIEMFGKDKAELVLGSGGRAIDEIERIVKEEKIDCEFMRCPVFMYANDMKEYEDLENEDEGLDELGLKHDFRREDKLFFSDFGYLEVPNQAKFHPMKYLHTLAAKAEESGVRICENTEALKVVEESPLTIETKGGKITAQKLIVASYYPFNNPKSTHFKKGMYRSYVLEVDVPKNVFMEGLYWDRNNPYHYFRIDKGQKHDRMILGGADHRNEIKMDREKNFSALEDYLKGIMGEREYRITKKWSGPILESIDGLPLIGKYEPNQYVATAFSGNGMTYSMIAGLLLKDLITAQDNQWKEIYNPKRELKAKALLKKGLDYTEEFIGGAVKNLFRQ